MHREPPLQALQPEVIGDLPQPARKLVPRDAGTTEWFASQKLKEVTVDFNGDGPAA